MGEHFGEQVLLIKSCWGGRSVRKDFLPPSAAMPSDEELQNVGSHEAYHYLGSSKMLYSIGEAFGEGMIGMLKH